MNSNLCPGPGKGPFWGSCKRGRKGSGEWKPQEAREGRSRGPAGMFGGSVQKPAWPEQGDPGTEHREEMGWGQL